MERTLVTEQSLGKVTAWASQMDFDSIEELNKRLEEVLKRDELPGPEPGTPLEAAQQLIYGVADAKTAEARRLLAQQALDISRDCADALRILAEFELEPAARQAMLDRAVEAGRAHFEPAGPEDPDGTVWTRFGNRPYLRAIAALGLHFKAQGDATTAERCFQQMMDLNPGDNQGARYFLAPLLAARGDTAAFEALERAFRGDVESGWPYDRALLRFKTHEGPSADAEDALTEGFALNGRIPLFLLGLAPLPERIPSAVEAGSFDEAIVYAFRAGDEWRGVPGALDWLRERAAADSQSSKTSRPDRTADSAPKPELKDRLIPSPPTLWRHWDLAGMGREWARNHPKHLSRKQRQEEQELLARIRGMKNPERLIRLAGRIRTDAEQALWRERMIQHGPRLLPAIKSALVVGPGYVSDSDVMLRVLALAPQFGDRFCDELLAVFDALPEMTQAHSCMVFGYLRYAEGLETVMRCYVRLAAIHDKALLTEDEGADDEMLFIGPLWALVDLNHPDCDAIMAEHAKNTDNFPEFYGFAARSGGQATFAEILKQMPDIAQYPDYNREPTDALFAMAAIVARLDDKALIDELVSALPSVPDIQVDDAYVRRVALEAPANFAEYYA